MRTIDPGKHAARRDAILSAARSCFARKGFHQTSTAAICAQAGMSPGNLFHYFPTKQAIIAAIVDQEGSETAAYFAGVRGSTDAYGALLDFMDLVLALAADGDFAGLALDISAEAMRDTDIAARVARNDATLRRGLQTLLEEAAAAGQVDAALDAAQTASWISALIDGIFNRVAVDPQYAPLAQRASLHLLLARFLRPALA
ncbi:TetR/AcrR family transcriptional regulator [Janthinobacterium lividum]|uniref:TetR/AcrR family transcriptional regulator n=1 Tax=Janthinobacterium lividum TaxID=29581 RepID=A0ABU0XU46_9BURK|nr:TetR/AcrR family transcriptional regulator [Janthinobacterium lividum]MDQ4626499.1 TetR/AcrR family transcriptional regulator [Janthinobacterium lividum]MDQ4674534.1 TetR/AcrR family transcriptional regulator [Janthinobacterium lividum]MDQ4685265.1 TetR/AcrR family transcriptional regulator [Janthinobacterium lividum]